MAKLPATLLGTLFGGLAYYYARNIEPQQRDIKYVTLTLPRLTPAFDGYRIVQISDIHMDSYMTRQRLQAHVDAINQINPDLVVITGDFITAKIQYVVDDLIKPLQQLSSPDGVLAVLGNHDYRADGSIEEVREILRVAQIIELSNEFHTLKRDDEVLYIAGVDNVTARRARLDLVLEALPATGCAILLCHEPDFVDVVAPTMRFDAQFSGHTHGGQIRLPLIGAVWGPHHGHRYANGLYDVHGLHLYVNRGLGMVTLPLRFNCPPEITVFTLKTR